MNQLTNHTDESAQRTHFPQHFNSDNLEFNSKAYKHLLYVHLSRGDHRAEPSRTESSTELSVSVQDSI